MAWEKRGFHGFLQLREDGGRWRFAIRGFDTHGDPGMCSAVLFAGGFRAVPIDRANRILIAGKWYGPQHWNH